MVFQSGLSHYSLISSGVAGLGPGLGGSSFVPQGGTNRMNQHRPSTSFPEAGEHSGHAGDDTPVRASRPGSNRSGSSGGGGRRPTKRPHSSREDRRRSSLAMVIDGVKGTVSAAADMLTRKRRPSAEEPTFAEVSMPTLPTAVVCYFSTPSPDCGAVPCRAVGTWRCGCQGYDRQEGKPPECCFPAAICRDNKAPGDVPYVSSNQPDSAFTQCCRSSRGVPALRAHWIVQAVSCVANIRSYRIAQDSRVIDTVEYPPSPSLKPAIPLFPLPFLPPVSGKSSAAPVCSFVRCGANQHPLITVLCCRDQAFRCCGRGGAHRRQHLQRHSRAARKSLAGAVPSHA